MLWMLGNKLILRRNSPDAYRKFHFTAAPASRSSDPVLKSGEVVLDIAACGLNFADLVDCQGTYQTPSRHPWDSSRYGDRAGPTSRFPHR
jgi:hypothetical protein